VFPAPALFDQVLDVPAIKGVIETSFVDWPERLCAVLFIGGCNFRCPFCHNPELVLAPEALATLSMAQVLEQLAPLRKWLGGICITGGEPTLDPHLGSLVALLKAEGWWVKLDTNGSRPEVLEQLLAGGLLDMVAMDVKAPLTDEQYRGCAGVRVDLKVIRRSIALLRESGIAHQFRMTVVPGFHGEREVEAWVASLVGRGRLTLQNFKPGTTLNPALLPATGFPPAIFDGLCRLVPERQEKE